MAIARVQEVDSGNLNAGLVATRSVTLAAGPTQNNLLIAIGVFGSDITGAAMSSSGWTLAKTNTSSDLTLAVWYKVAGAGESSTVTVTTTNNAHIGLKVIEYSGTATSSPLDVTEETTSGWAGSNWWPYVGTLHAATKGSLHIYAAALHETNASSAFTAADTGTFFIGYHGGTTRGTVIGSAFKHTNGSDDKRVQCYAYEYLAGATEAEAADYSTGFTSRSSDFVAAIGLIFKASGAAAADTPFSGSGSVSATGAQSTTKDSTQAAATGWTVAFGSAPPQYHLMIVSIRHLGTVEAITPPAGWTEISYTSIAPSDNPKTFYKVAGAAEGNSYAFTWATNQQIIGLAADVAYISPGPTYIDRTEMDVHLSGGTAALNKVVSRPMNNGTPASGSENTVYWINNAQGSLGAGAHTVGSITASAWFLAASTMGAGGGDYRGFIGVASYPGTAGSFRESFQHDATGSTWNQFRHQAFLFQSAVPGSDHWGWAEGSDPSDSWHSVA